ncbi:MAG: hypothetical protein ABI571_03360 [Actinomycetota bacterium]
MKIAVQAWAPDYGSEVEIAWDQGRPEDLDTTAEGVGWKALPAGYQDDLTWEEVLFVDGVRRTDARLFVTPDGSDRAASGVAASIGVGAVSCDIGAGNGAPVRTARIAAAKVTRVIALGGGGDIQLSGGPGLEYRGLPVAGFAPDDLDHKVHGLMRDSEAVLAIEFAAATGSDRLVVVDGPLAKMNPGATAVIGMIKSHNATYLDDTENALVSALERGERTPFFFFGGPQRPRYSWYLRLCERDDDMHGWHGIVRCEVPAAHSVGTVTTLADASTCLLPRFASLPHWDARAPQNLVPIAGLEKHLRHLLGARELAYRKIREAALRLIGTAGGERVA